MNNYDKPTFLGPDVSDEFLIATNYLERARDNGGFILSSDFDGDGDNTIQAGWLNASYRAAGQNAHTDEALRDAWMSTPQYGWLDSFFGASLLQSVVPGGETWVNDPNRIALDRAAAGLETTTQGGGALGRLSQLAMGEGESGLEFVQNIPEEKDFNSDEVYNNWAEANPMVAAMLQQKGFTSESVKGTKNADQFLYAVRSAALNAQINSEVTAFYNDVEQNAILPSWTLDVAEFTRDLALNADFQAEIAGEVAIGLLTGGTSLAGSALRRIGKAGIAAANKGGRTAVMPSLVTAKAGKMIKSVGDAARQNVTLLGLPENVRDRWAPNLLTKSGERKDLLLAGWPHYFAAASAEGAGYMAWSSINRQYLAAEQQRLLTGEERPFSFEELSKEMMLGSIMGPGFFVGLSAAKGAIKSTAKAMGMGAKKLDAMSEKRLRTRRIAAGEDANKPETLLGYTGEAKGYGAWESQQIGIAQGLIEKMTGGRSAAVLRMANTGTLRARGIDPAEFASAVAKRVDALDGSRMSPIRAATEINSIMDQLSGRMPSDANAKAEYMKSRGKLVVQAAVNATDDGKRVQTAWRNKLSREGLTGQAVDKVVEKIAKGEATLADFRRLEKLALKNKIATFDAEAQYQMMKQVMDTVRDLEENGKDASAWKDLSTADAQQTFKAAMAQFGLKGIDLSSPQKLAETLRSYAKASRGFFGGDGMMDAIDSAFLDRMGMAPIATVPSKDFNAFLKDRSAVSALDEKIEQLVSGMDDETLENGSEAFFKKIFDNLTASEQALFDRLSAGAETVNHLKNFEQQQRDFAKFNAGVKDTVLADPEFEVEIKNMIDNVVDYNGNDRSQWDASREARLAGTRKMLARALGANEIGTERMTYNDILSLLSGTVFDVQVNGGGRGFSPTKLMGSTMNKGGWKIGDVITKLRMLHLVEEARTFKTNGKPEVIKDVIKVRLEEMSEGHSIEDRRLAAEEQARANGARERFAQEGTWAGGATTAQEYFDEVVKIYNERFSGKGTTGRALHRIMTDMLGFASRKAKEGDVNRPEFVAFVSALGGGEKAMDSLTPAEAAQALADLGRDPFSKPNNNSLSSTRPLSMKEKQRLFERARMVQLIEQLRNLSPGEIQKARKILEETGKLERLGADEYIGKSTIKELAAFFGIPQRALFAAVLDPKTNKLDSIDDMIRFVDDARTKSQDAGVHTHDSSMWQQFLWGLNEDIMARYSNRAGATSGSPTVGAREGSAGDWLNIFYQELVPMVRNLVAASDAARREGVMYKTESGEEISGDRLFEPEVDGPSADMVKVYVDGTLKEMQLKPVADDKSQGSMIQEGGRTASGRKFNPDTDGPLDVFEMLMDGRFEAVSEAAAFDVYVRGVESFLPKYKNADKKAMREIVMDQVSNNKKEFRAFMKELFAGGQYGQGERARRELMNHILGLKKAKGISTPFGEYSGVADALGDKVYTFVDEFASMDNDKAAARIGLAVTAEDLAESFKMKGQTDDELIKLASLKDNYGMDPDVALTLGALMQTADRRGLDFPGLLKQLGTDLDTIKQKVDESDLPADEALAQALPASLFLRESSEAIGRVARRANETIKARLAEESPALASLADEVIVNTFDDISGRLYYNVLGVLDPQGRKYKPVDKETKRRLKDGTQVGPNRTREDVAEVVARENDMERYGFDIRDEMGDFNTEARVVQYLLAQLAGDYDLSPITGNRLMSYEDFVSDQGRLGLTEYAARETGTANPMGVPSLQRRALSYSKETAWDNPQPSRAVIKEMIRQVDSLELPDYSGWYAKGRNPWGGQNIDPRTLVSPPENEVASATTLDYRTEETQRQLYQAQGIKSVVGVADEAARNLRESLEAELSRRSQGNVLPLAQGDLLPLIARMLKGEGNFEDRLFDITDLEIPAWLPGSETSGRALSEVLAAVGNPAFRLFEEQGQRAGMVPFTRDARRQTDKTAVLPRYTHSKDARQRRGAALGLTDGKVRYDRETGQLRLPYIGIPLPTRSNTITTAPDGMRKGSTAETVGTYEGSTIFTRTYKGTGEVLPARDTLAQITAVNPDVLGRIMLLGATPALPGVSSGRNTLIRFGNDMDDVFDATDATRKARALKNNVRELRVKEDPNVQVAIPGTKGTVPLTVVDWDHHKIQLQQAMHRELGGLKGLYKMMSKHGAQSHFKDAAIKLLGAGEDQITDFLANKKPERVRRMTLPDDHLRPIREAEKAARERIGREAYRKVAQVLPETTDVDEISEQLDLPAEDVRTILLDPNTYKETNAFRMLSDAHDRVGENLEQMLSDLEGLLGKKDPRVGMFAAELRVLRGVLAQMDLDFFGEDFTIRWGSDRDLASPQGDTTQGMYIPRTMPIEAMDPFQALVGNNTIILNVDDLIRNSGDGFSATRVLVHELGHAWVSGVKAEMPQYEGILKKAFLSEDGREAMKDLVEALVKLSGDDEAGNTKFRQMMVGAFTKNEKFKEMADEDPMLLDTLFNEFLAEFFSGVMFKGVDDDAFQKALNKAEAKHPGLVGAVMSIITRMATAVRNQLLKLKGAFDRVEGADKSTKDLADFIRKTTAMGAAPEMMGQILSNRNPGPEFNPILRAIELDHDETVRNMMISRGQDPSEGDFDKFMRRLDAEREIRRDPRSLTSGDSGFYYDPDGAVIKERETIAAAGRPLGLDNSRADKMDEKAAREAHQEQANAIVAKVLAWASQHDKVRVAADGSFVAKVLDNNAGLRTLTTGLFGTASSDVSDEPVARLMALLHASPRAMTTHFDETGGTPNFYSALTSSIQALAPSLDAYETLRRHKTADGSRLSDNTIRAVNTQVMRSLVLGNEPDFSRMDALDANAQEMATDLFNKTKAYFVEEKRIQLDSHDPKLNTWKDTGALGMPRRGLFDDDAWVTPTGMPIEAIIKVNGVDRRINNVQEAREAFLADLSDIPVRFTQATKADQTEFNKIARERLIQKFGLGMSKADILEQDPRVPLALFTSHPSFEIRNWAQSAAKRGPARVSDLRKFFEPVLPAGQVDNIVDRVLDVMSDRASIDEMLQRTRDAERAHTAAISDPHKWNMSRARGAKYSDDFKPFSSVEIFTGKDGLDKFYDVDLPSVLDTHAREVGYTSRAIGVTYAITGIRGLTHIDFADAVYKFMAPKAKDKKGSAALAGVAHKLQAFHAKASGGNLYQANAEGGLMEDLSRLTRGVTMMGSGPGFGFLSNVELMFNMLDNYGNDGWWSNFVQSLRSLAKLVRGEDIEVMRGTEAALMEASGAAADRIIYESTQGVTGNLGTPTDYGVIARMRKAGRSAIGAITGESEQGLGRVAGLTQALGQIGTEIGGLPKMTRLSRAMVLTKFRTSLIRDIENTDSPLWTLRELIRDWEAENPDTMMTRPMWAKLSKQAGYKNFDWPLTLQKAGVFAPGALEDLADAYKLYEANTSKDPVHKRDIGYDPAEMSTVMGELAAAQTTTSARMKVRRQQEILDRVNGASIEIMNQRVTEGYGWDDLAFSREVNSPIGKMFFSLMSFTLNFTNQRVFNNAGMPFLGRLLPAIAIYIAAETLTRSLREGLRDSDAFFTDLEEDPVGTIASMGLTHYPVLGWGSSVQPWFADSVRKMDWYKDAPWVGENFEEPYTYDPLSANAPLAFLNRWFKQTAKVATGEHGGITSGRWWYDTMRYLGPLNHPLVYGASNAAGISRSSLRKRGDKSVEPTTVPNRAYVPRVSGAGITATTPIPRPVPTRDMPTRKTTQQLDQEIFGTKPEQAPDELM